MSRSFRSTIALLVLLGTAVFLSGCGNEPGYSEQAPPEGGPQQNSHVPPGEKGGTASPSDSADVRH